jgi:hypothetical protein
MRFRHRNETVDAFRWTGDDTQREKSAWAVAALQAGTIRIANPGPHRLKIKTPAGWTTAKPGDWIVKWPSGDFEVCPDPIFRKRCAALPRQVLDLSGERRRDRPGLSRPSALPSNDGRPPGNGQRRPPS